MLCREELVSSHIKIGSYLKSLMEQEKTSEYLFDMVSHFNKFPEAIVGYSQRIEMAQLNLAVKIMHYTILNSFRQALRLESLWHFNLLGF
jgi:predicted RNA methylase